MNPETDRDRLLVSVGALAAELAEGPTPVLLDVRWRLAARPGIESYRRGHLPGAVFADLDRDLAGPPGPAGRHPLPDPAAFQAAMRAAGVSQDRPVVVTTTGTPRSPPAAGGRCGTSGTKTFGCSMAATGRGPVPPQGASRSPRPSPLRPPATSSRSPVACRCSTRRARRRRREPGCCSTPGRGSATAGRPSLPTRRRGHIPGAVSAPTIGNVNPDGTFRDAAELTARFAALGAADGHGAQGGAPVGAYCGSGVTAAHEVLALTLAGIPAALYVGSWSNWIADPARPVATGG